MKFLIPKLVLLFVCCVGSIGDSHHANASDTIEMTSPDGLVMATVSLNAQSELAYEVQWKENIVIEPSSLGITVGSPIWLLTRMALPRDRTDRDGVSVPSIERAFKRTRVASDWTAI